MQGQSNHKNIKKSKGISDNNISLRIILLHEVLLLILSVLFYSLSFPGAVFKDGLWFFGWIALLPLFVLVVLTSWKRLFLWAFFYGAFTAFFSQYWLFLFHPLAMWLVVVIQSIYFIFVLSAIKLTMGISFPGRNLVPAFVWVGFEYLKTLGFLGYPFGIIGYSQAFNPFILQGASIFGVWGISYLLVAPQVWLTHIMKSKLKGYWWSSFKNFIDKFKSYSSWKNKVFNGWKMSRNSYGLYLWFYLSFFLFLVVGGVFIGEIKESSGSLSVSLIQNNAGILSGRLAGESWDRRDPLYRKRSDYYRDYSANVRQTNLALKDNPDLVVWCETSFVPGLYWYSHFGVGRNKGLVDRFLAQNQSWGIPLLTGNSDGRKKKEDEAATFRNRVDYNAAVLLDGGEIKDVYRKQKLVPFTENYPFGSSFPFLKNYLEEKWDCAFWSKGKDNSLFLIKDAKIATPICFEDGFGSLVRSMAKEGANLIINLTNDSWSGSEAAQRQHFAFSIFRAVENRMTVLRAAQSGVTVQISPLGKVVKELEPFIEGNMTVSALLYDHPFTLYQLWGDLFGKMSCVIALLWLILILGLKRREVKIKKSRLKRGKK